MKSFFFLDFWLFFNKIEKGHSELSELWHSDLGLALLLKGNGLASGSTINMEANEIATLHIFVITELLNRSELWNLLGLIWIQNLLHFYSLSTKRPLVLVVLFKPFLRLLMGRKKPCFLIPTVILRTGKLKQNTFPKFFATVEV